VENVHSSHRDSLKVTLIFPILDNDGEPFDPETWRWWQREMLRLGDYTELGPAEGVFRGHTDRNRIIVMIVKRAALDVIREFLKEARRRFEQEAMYLEFHPVEFELIVE
jgi:hypothetical protein